MINMINDILAMVVVCFCLPTVICCVFCYRLEHKVDKKIGKTMKSVSEGFDLARAYIRQEAERLDLEVGEYTGKRWNGENHDS